MDRTRTRNVWIVPKEHCSTETDTLFWYSRFLTSVHPWLKYKGVCYFQGFAIYCHTGPTQCCGANWCNTRSSCVLLLQRTQLHYILLNCISYALYTSFSYVTYCTTYCCTMPRCPSQCCTTHSSTMHYCTTQCCIMRCSTTRSLHYTMLHHTMFYYKPVHYRMQHYTVF